MKACVLIWHDDQEAFGGILVRLQLVVGAAYAGAASQEQEELGWRVRIVGGLGHVDFDVIVLGDLLYTLSASGAL